MKATSSTWSLYILPLFLLKEGLPLPRTYLFGHGADTCKS